MAAEAASARRTGEGAEAPASFRPAASEALTNQPRRKPANRGKAGGRTHGKLVWLTEAENTLLESRATESGLSVASYLRASALGDAGPRARRSPTIEKEALGAAIAELNRVGNNVNQIARALNVGKDHDPAELDTTLAELRSALTLMLAAINV